MAMIEIKRVENGHKGRITIYENEEAAGLLTYTTGGNTLFIIDHTHIEEGHNGKGFGQKLVMDAVAMARERNLKIIPLCPFAKSIFDKNMNIEDVLHV